MKYLIFILALTLGACSSTTKLDHDKEYGLSPKAPILVGGLSSRSGPASERAYLDRLRGPNGEMVTYERKESCCSFATPNGIGGGGRLDIYEVQYEGQRKPVLLYLNMYDPPADSLRAPKGFTLAQ